MTTSGEDKHPERGSKGRGRVLVCAQEGAVQVRSRNPGASLLIL